LTAFRSQAGDVVFTKDKAGFTLAKELQSLIGRIVSALDAEKQLLETVELNVTETVKNPFV
jgi:predicted phage gp36 major capsid-like protein